MQQQDVCTVGMVAKVLKTYDNGCQMSDVNMYMRHDIKFVKCWQDTYDMNVKCKRKRNCWQDCSILWHTMMSCGMSCHGMSGLGCQIYTNWLIIIHMICFSNVKEMNERNVLMLTRHMTHGNEYELYIIMPYDKYTYERYVKFNQIKNM